jgi:hypothetical protein
MAVDKGVHAKDAPDKDDDLAPAGQRPDNPADKSKVMSAEDEADLLAFRAQQEQLRIEAEKIAPPPPSHYLHLENGQVVKSAGTMTHWHGLAVVNAVPISE